MHVHTCVHITSHIHAHRARTADHRRTTHCGPLHMVHSSECIPPTMDPRPELVLEAVPCSSEFVHSYICVYICIYIYINIHTRTHECVITFALAYLHAWNMNVCVAFRCNSIRNCITLSFILSKIVNIICGLVFLLITSHMHYIAVQFPTWTANISHSYCQP
jgi:hypothetical protein